MEGETYVKSHIRFCYRLPKNEKIYKKYVFIDIYEIYVTVRKNSLLQFRTIYSNSYYSLIYYE